MTYAGHGMAQLQAQLQEAKLQKEELDAMLSLAKDANQQDQESLDDLAAKQEEASDKIEQLREAYAAFCVVTMPVCIMTDDIVCAQA